MKLIADRTEELQQGILRNPSLLKELSQTVAKVIGEKIALPTDTTYVFVPRVYSRPTFWPEVYAMASVLEHIPFGGAGPIDPQIAKYLEKDRMAHHATKDSTSESNPTSMREDILKNPKLFMPLSEAIAKVLANHNVTFKANETFSFIPVVVKKPIFNGQVTAVAPLAENSIWELNHTEELDVVLDPGIIINGIPAPDLLVALEQQRIGWNSTALIYNFISFSSSMGGGERIKDLSLSHAFFQLPIS